MRLIDADALHNALEESFITNIHEELAIENILDLQPTINPVKRGHWEDDFWAMFDGIQFYNYRCSECCHVYDVNHNFCPDCGADMREYITIQTTSDHGKSTQMGIVQEKEDVSA